MSYDLMVFEPTVAPKERQQFLKWYKAQAEWGEGHSYDDPSVASPSLQAWFQEMIRFFPAMNGPQASEDPDDPKVTDHCIGKSVIYSAFAWSCAEEAHRKTRALAVKHGVGFFDVSANDGEILFPGDQNAASSNPKPWWKFW